MPGSTWKGKPVDQMSREELIELVEELGRLYQETQMASADALDRLLRRFMPMPPIEKRPRTLEGPEPFVG